MSVEADWKGLVISEACYFALGDGILELAPGFFVFYMCMAALKMAGDGNMAGHRLGCLDVSAPMTAAGLKIGH